MQQTQEKTEAIWNLLREIPDPEIPVINIVELGVVREVSYSGDTLTIAITPTYTGCPAMKAIEESIYSHLRASGIPEIHVKTVLKPAWTTDWLSDEAREKLRIYGIAPPERVGPQHLYPFLSEKKSEVACPRCGSTHTTLKSFFGSTACKALYFCEECKEPFDHFKCI